MFHVNVTPYPSAPVWKEEIPEIEDACRYQLPSGMLFTYVENAVLDSADSKLTAIAVFVLLIACINFMNLSTARSATRTRVSTVMMLLSKEFSKLIIISCLIAILTVSYQAARAALTNPADALRYEYAFTAKICLILHFSGIISLVYLIIVKLETVSIRMK